MISCSSDTDKVCEPSRALPRQGGEPADLRSLWLKEEGRSLFALLLHFITSTCDVFIHLKKMMKWSPMGVFHFRNNKDVCFFGDAGRTNFHQPLFPHYTGRVFNIQVGGSLKGTNFGNPHLEKHCGFLWFFSSKGLKGLPSKIWDPWQYFKVAADKNCWDPLADEKNDQNEGTMRKKVTAEPRIGPTEPRGLMSQISSLSETFVRLCHNNHLIVITHKIIPL